MPSLKEKLTKCISTGVNTAFENLAFLEAIPITNMKGISCRGFTTVSLLIHNPIQWEIYLRMPDELIEHIVQGIFAKPLEEIDQPTRDDLAMELINTIVGRFLNDLLPDSCYEIGLPRLSKEEIPDSEETDLVWHFQTEKYNFCLQAFGDQEPLKKILERPENTGIKADKI